MLRVAKVFAQNYPVKREKAKLKFIFMNSILVLFLLYHSGNHLHISLKNTYF